MTQEMQVVADALIVIAAKEQHAAWRDLMRSPSAVTHKRYADASLALERACDVSMGYVDPGKPAVQP